MCYGTVHIVGFDGMAVYKPSDLDQTALFGSLYFDL